MDQMEVDNGSSEATMASPNMENRSSKDSKMASPQQRQQYVQKDGKQQYIFNMRGHHLKDQ